MRKEAVIFAGVCALACAFSGPACAQQARSSAELIDQAASFDNTTVVFEGEVIGDIMARKDGAWANVHDGKNALGCWLPAREAAKITVTGGDKSTGERVEVSGVFHRACLAHGGDLDIHADTVRVTAAGAGRPHGVSSRKKELSLMLLGVLCLALILKVLK